MINTILQRSKNENTRVFSFLVQMKFSASYEHLKLVNRPYISYWLWAFEPRETLPFPVLLVVVLT